MERPTAAHRDGNNASDQAADRVEVGETTLQSYTQPLSGTLIKFEMVPVPGGTMTVQTEEGTKEVQIEPFWIGKTEVSWDAYDVFVYGLDESKGIAPGEADAITKPSRPYVLPGESFGHEDHPALGMTYLMAQNYVKWLSAKTGRNYRLATERQWEYACRAGLEGFSRPLDEYVWYQGNANARTHEMTSLAPNGLGVYHMLGHVAEWVRVKDGEPVIKGGSFRLPADEINCNSRAAQQPAWNRSDPQIPKSNSWLPDAPFVGLRIVRIPE